LWLMNNKYFISNQRGNGRKDFQGKREFLIT